MRTYARAPLALSIALLAVLGAACKKDKADDAPKTGSGTTKVVADAGTGSGSGTGSAVVEAPADAAPAPTAALANPFFYAIEKDGKTIHILGTVHLGIEPTRLPPVVWDKLDKARAFAMETNIMDPALLGAVMRDDGTTLDQELGPDYWAKLETALGKDMAGNVKTLKASVVATLLAVRGLPMTQPMDLALMQKAKSNGARIVFLEEAKLQQALLDKWMDARALKEMLDDLAGGEEKNKQMLAAYTAGDEAAVEKLTFDREEWKKTGRPEAEYDEMVNEMLLDRNASWIAELEKLAAEGDAFVAVGAAHLYGKGSVLELFAAKGYKVTRVAP